MSHNKEGRTAQSASCGDVTSSEEEDENAARGGVANLDWCGVGGGGRRIGIGHARRAAGDTKMMWSESMEDTERRSGAAGHRGSRRRRPTMEGVRVATM